MKLSRLVILPIVFLSACAEYEPENFVGYDNGAQVYRVSIGYDKLIGRAKYERLIEDHIALYCPNGYRELNRTEPVQTGSNAGGWYGGAYLAPSIYMRIETTFACVGEPAVVEAR